MTNLIKISILAMKVLISTEYMILAVTKFLLLGICILIGLIVMIKKIYTVRNLQMISGIMKIISSL